jgi:hypothetical protein
MVSKMTANKNRRELIALSRGHQGVRCWYLIDGLSAFSDVQARGVHDDVAPLADGGRQATMTPTSNLSAQ